MLPSTPSPEDQPVWAGSGATGSFAVEVSHLRKRYGRLEVLSDVNLRARTQQTLVILGPSGSGKSTLLRTIAGLEPFHSGEIRVNGDPYLRANGGQVNRGTKAGGLRRSIGMVFQHFTLFPQLTVIQNVMLGPYRVLHHSRDAARRQAELVLQRVGLLNKQDSFPAHLSGGEMQRAAIARELAMERRVILFDEVTSALDPELVHEVVEVMQELGRTGMTMIVVTHEMGFARKAAQEIVFMDAGAVVETGSPEAIFGDAKEERTRAFLSKMLS